jgi:hypothetical protein
MLKSFYRGPRYAEPSYAEKMRAEYEERLAREEDQREHDITEDHECAHAVFLYVHGGTNVRLSIAKDFSTVPEGGQFGSCRFIGLRDPFEETVFFLVGEAADRILHGVKMPTEISEMTAMLKQDALKFPPGTSLDRADALAAATKIDGNPDDTLLRGWAAACAFVREHADVIKSLSAFLAARGGTLTGMQVDVFLRSKGLRRGQDRIVRRKDGKIGRAMHRRASDFEAF